ncbi:MAG: T9SS type A sorting domain-containing protein [Bacteroidales bacterium]|jgi:hypothetical protein|nr:T9SS type A sorting domain-containing protein [Bacteroidales bacterium]
MQYIKRVTIQLLFLCVFFSVLSAAQDKKPAVLQIKGNNGFTSYYDTNTKLSGNILDKGQVGAATVEFWAKAVPGDNNIPYNTWQLTNLQKASKRFAIQINNNAITVNMGNATTTVNLMNENRLVSNVWYHFAFVFNKSGGAIKIYINGKKRAQIPYNMAISNNLFITTGADHHLFIAEYRAWKKERSRKQIELTRYRSLYNDPSHTLEEFYNNGLEISYSHTADVQPVAISHLPKLLSNIWENSLKVLNKDDIAVNQSKFTARYSNKDLIMLRSDVDHPVISLSKILLIASDGNGKSYPGAGGNFGIGLKWPHIKNTKAYIIKRKNIAVVGQTSSEIHRIDNLNNRTISEYITYYDKDILPDELYQYQVIPVWKDNTTGSAGMDIGFVSSNGQISGALQTAQQVSVQDVKIKAKPANNAILPGSALEFRSGASPINVENVDIFRNVGNTGTIEFWYRTPVAGSGDNTIFRLGTQHIVINGNTIKVELNGVNYITGTKTDDNMWHHYAFTYGKDGAKLYEDGRPISGASTDVPYSLDLNTVSYYSFNHEVNITYQIDEIRIWKVKRTDAQIFRYKDHMIGDNNNKLTAYYRLNLKDANTIYNIASETIGSLQGTSKSSLIYLNANQQPELSYAVFTDTNGQYKFTTLNSSVNSYVITPVKPNHEFSPDKKVIPVKRTLQPAEKTANFTDISALQVSGQIMYKVSDSNVDEGYQLYPVLQGTELIIDGVKVTSTDKNSKVKTDAKGVFAITSPLGRHKFQVAENSSQSSSSGGSAVDRYSIDFNGMAASEKDGIPSYAESVRAVNSNGKAFTWSLFIKPDISANPDKPIPANQTLLHWKDIILQLHNNKTLKLLINGNEVLSSIVTESPKYTFVAVSVNPLNNTIALKVNDSYKTAPFPAQYKPDINAKFYIGAEKESGEDKFKHFSCVNMDILEYRDSAYSEPMLTDVMNGEIVDQDTSHLKLSYTFEHKKGKRAINMVSDKTDNLYLTLSNGAMFSEVSASAYNRKFKFHFKPSNTAYNPKDGDKFYQLNVVEPISNLDFECTTRRTLYGNIVVPCCNSVGDWVGTIRRTDIMFPAYTRSISNANFNDDRTVFIIKDLLPGQYLAEITNVKTGVKVSSSVIDLRNGNQSFDFVYRKDLQADIEVNKFDIKGINDKKNLEKYKGAVIPNNCNGKYNIKAGECILVSVNVYEDYEGNKCPVTGAMVNLGGDMFITQLKMKSNEKGKSNFIIQVGTPNFMEDASNSENNYTRTMSVGISHLGRNFNITERGYVTGARRANSNFTMINPAVGLVLHDPPGDNSSSTIDKNTTFSHSYSFEKGTDITMGFDLAAGSDIETSYIGLAIAAPLGVGAAVGVNVKQLSSEISVSGGTSGSFSYRKTGGNGYSISLNNSISTPSFDDYVGEDADTFIGTSNVVTFGTGKSLEVKNCVPKVITDKTVVTSEVQSTFVYTKQEIMDNVIIKLQDLLLIKLDEINGRDPQSLTPEEKAKRDYLDMKKTIDNVITDADKKNSEVKNYLHQIDRWIEIIDDNHNTLLAKNFDNSPSISSTTSALKGQSDKPDSDIITELQKMDEEIAYSAGPSITYSFSRSTESSSGSSVGGGNTTHVNFSKGITILGFKLDINGTTSITGMRNNNYNNVFSKGRVDQFTLSDDDAGDQFSVKLRRDPRYDTPMFRVVAGQSMCPFESGTVPRQGVEIVSDKYVGYGIGKEPIVYNLILRNTQIARDRTPKKYQVGMPAASNPKGAIVSINGSPISSPNTGSFTFKADGTPPTGVQKEIPVTITISPAENAEGDVSYEGIKIKMYSECENNGFTYISYRKDEYQEVGVVPIYEISLDAHFSGPCIKQIIADKPAADWVVNGNQNNMLDFRFRIPEVTKKSVPDNLTVDIEYTIPGNNDPVVLTSLTKKMLKDNLQDDGYITYSADVSSMPDGDYNFRIVPVCDDRGSNSAAARSNPTPFARGRISRSAPTVVSTNPQKGGILTSGTISATFSSAINPATVNTSALQLRGILGGLPKDLISAQFDVKTDSIYIPHNSEFNISGAYTIEMWIKPQSFPSSGAVPVITKGNNYSVELTSAGRVRINGMVLSSKSLQPGLWTHLAAVYDGSGAIQIYLNGKPAGSGAFNSITTNNRPMVIASNRSGNSFIGMLDEIRLWDIAQTPNNISANKNSQLLGNEDNLKAYFVLDNNALKGADGAIDEAIRDYTGNASGTKANGLSFVNGQSNAAPLDITRLAQNLQYTSACSVGNTVLNINPVFTDKVIEGAELTVIMNEGKLQDPLGNKIRRYSWDFVVNRNVIRWSQNNVRINQIQGNTSLIDNIDLDNSQGGIDVRYRFRQLPNWLTVKSGAKQSDFNTISKGFINRDIVFSVAPYLNSGIHTTNVYIETFNAKTGVALGVEKFALEVNVSCSSPDYGNYDPNSHIGRMNFTSKVMFDGVQSFDTNDKVAVYLNNTLRGSASVGSNGKLQLTVSGNPGETGALSFRVWDASECTEYYSIVEKYNFTYGTFKGSISSPVTFTVGKVLSRRITLQKGYQEISFNVRDNESGYNLSLSSIQGLHSDDRLLDAANPQIIIATTNSSGTFIGAKSTIDIRKSYIIQSKTAKTIYAHGLPVPVNTDIQISGSNNSNPIAYLPQDLQRTSYALRSLTATTVQQGDRIVRRNQEAQYDNSLGWVGSLTHLTPGFGYIYYASNNGTLNYSGIAQAHGVASSERNSMYNQQFNDKEMLAQEIDNTYLKNAERIGWIVNVNEYPNFMYVNAIVASDKLDVNQEYTIAAYVDGKITGIAKPQQIDGKYYYFVGIGGFGKGKITFKLYDEHGFVDLDNTMNFNTGSTIGTVEKPYQLTVSPEMTDIGSGNVTNGEYVLTQNTPNPLTTHAHISYSVPADQKVVINLYNTLGKLEQVLVNRTAKAGVIYTVKIDRKLLKPGVYIYRMESEGKTIKRKMIVQ